MATKKTPARSAKARKPAARARQTARPTAAARKKAVAAAKPKAAAAKKRARASDIGVVRKGPAARTVAALIGGRIPRRAVFVDVENTSSEEDLFEVLEALHIDRAAQPTEVMAVGNWRAIGQRLARHLASTGAQLMHTAPNATVKDWSDLWIAVAAGCWLGTAQPGDQLEIVSNDRAFDAVGDAAAARGVVYRRLLHKRGAAALTAVATAADEEEPKRRRRSRGGRRRRGRGSDTASTATHDTPPPAARHAAPTAHAPARTHGTRAHAAPAHELEPHGATRDQMVSVIGRLAGSDPHRWINLDVLEKTLKSEGFARPPGSPRLVTRLRMLKDVEVDSHGRVRLALTAAVEPAPPAVDSEAEAPAPAEAAPKKRRRRRKPTAGSAADSGGASVEAATAPYAFAPMVDPPPE